MTPARVFILSLALILGCFLSSALRGAALPIALVGLALAPDRSQPPDLLVFEDGREVALIDDAGALVPLKKRPNDFVFSQWTRAFPSTDNAANPAKKKIGFECESIVPADDDDPTKRDGEAAGAPTSPPVVAANGTPPAATDASKPSRPPKTMQFCSATTRNSLKIHWTDDYRQTGRACEGADIAIVARAIRLEACRSGAALVTLRSLRRTGSLAIGTIKNGGTPVVTSSMGPSPEEWNLHRLAPWPESWRQAAGSDEKNTPSAPGVIGDRR